jgi:hypothetical protein
MYIYALSVVVVWTIMNIVKLKVSLLLVTFFFLFVAPVWAKAPAISTSGKLNKVTNSVNAYFGNMKGVSKVTYTLMYEANGVGQGVVGSFAPGKKSALSKNLFLGTCSGKVCVRHKNVKNIQMEVVTKYANGKSTKKLLKIK